MKTIKPTLFALAAFAVMTLAATGANAAFNQALDLYLSDDIPGLTVLFTPDGADTDLNPMDLEAYLPNHTYASQRTMWSMPWVNTTTGLTNYYSGFNPSEDSFYFLNSDQQQGTSHFYTDYDWSTPTAALASAATLGLNWFTVGLVQFGTDYDTFTIAGINWDGDGFPAQEFAGSFTRATPIPGAVWLLGSGLLGLAGLTRKKRNRA